MLLNLGRVPLHLRHLFPERRRFCLGAAMAKSKYDYVRQFEADDRCLRNTWIVVRIDGNNFHAFSQRHDYQKPNDSRALGLMNAAARGVLDEFSAVFLAYGQSDEYSFVFRKDCAAFSRRASKLMSNVVSVFTAHFVFRWTEFFPDTRLQYPPCFDSRVVLYPTEKNLRDYLAWRQVDCHINNLYNTTFWSLVLKGGMSNRAAMERLKGTVSGDKNEILFSQFNINYNHLPHVFRKGTILVKIGISSNDEPSASVVTEANDDHDDEGQSADAANSIAAADEPFRAATRTKKGKKAESEFRVEELNRDLIQDEFWTTICRLEDFGAEDERPALVKNAPLDKINDFSKW